MKIAILTQPLHNNYGGLLQAFALQKVLKGMGHEVLTVDLPARPGSLYRTMRGIAGRAVRRYILKQKVGLYSLLNLLRTKNPSSGSTQAALFGRIFKQQKPSHRFGT